MKRKPTKGEASGISKKYEFIPWYNETFQHIHVEKEDALEESPYWWNHVYLFGGSAKFAFKKRRWKVTLDKTP